MWTIINRGLSLARSPRGRRQQPHLDGSFMQSCKPPWPLFDCRSRSQTRGLRSDGRQFAHTLLIHVTEVRAAGALCSNAFGNGKDEPIGRQSIGPVAGKPIRCLESWTAPSRHGSDCRISRPCLLGPMIGVQLLAMMSSCPCCTTGSGRDECQARAATPCFQRRRHLTQCSTPAARN